MKIVLLGALGQVGSEVLKTFQQAGHEVFALSRNDCDLANIRQIESCLSAYDPDLMVNTAAYTAVDKAEDESSLAELINTTAVGVIAQFCQKKNIPLIHLSTDYVFDGLAEKAYTEVDSPHPLGVYGQSKLGGEKLIGTILGQYIILRVSWVFGCHGSNFVKTILRLSMSKDELGIVDDQWGCPTSASDIARVLLIIANAALQPDFSHWGIYHYAGGDKTNWYAFAKEFISIAMQKRVDLTFATIQPISTAHYPTKAKRPRYSVLDSTKIETVFGVDRHSWCEYLSGVVEHELQRLG